MQLKFEGGIHLVTWQNGAALHDGVTLDYIYMGDSTFRPSAFLNEPDMLLSCRRALPTFGKVVRGYVELGAHHVLAFIVAESCNIQQSSKHYETNSLRAHQALVTEP